MLDSVHKPLRQVPSAILLLEQGSLLRSAFQARNDGCTSPSLDGCDDLVAVVLFVGDNVLGFVIRQQGCRLLTVVDLTRCHNQFDWAAFRVHRQVDLRAEPSARATETFATPPFPAACWWARITVESSIKHSRSGSFHASRSRFHTPRLHHRLNRWNPEFHGPNRSGRSRHGAPVFAIQSTASTNNRLFSAVRPGSPGLPGSSFLILSHCSSVISCRRIGVPP